MLKKEFLFLNYYSFLRPFLSPGVGLCGGKCVQKKVCVHKRLNVE